MAGKKNRTPGSELDSLIKAQERDLRLDGKNSGTVRPIDRRRAKREKLTLKERERELNFDGQVD